MFAQRFTLKLIRVVKEAFLPHRKAGGILFLENTATLFDSNFTNSLGADGNMVEFSILARDVYLFTQEC